jgi:hypothetical protein
VWPVLVVVGDEPVQQLLNSGDGGRLVRLCGQPLFQGLLEPFDFAAGGGVVGSGVLLGDAQALEFCL